MAAEHLAYNPPPPLTPTPNPQPNPIQVRGGGEGGLTWWGDVAQGPGQRALAGGPPPAAAHVHEHTLPRHGVLLVLAGVPVGEHRVAAVRPLVVIALLAGSEVTGV